MGKNNKSETADFRQKAEELLKTDASKSGLSLVDADMLRLIHELEVHQIELEMQNEELMSAFSERKRAEESLKASESRYRRLFESAKDGILVLDADTGKIADVNPFLIEMLGYSKHQFLDKAIWELEFFNGLFANLYTFSELQQEKCVRFDDLPLETADGRKISVEFVSNSYFEDNKKVIQCNIREITENKKIQNEIKFQANLLNHVGQSIIATDLSGNVIYWNNAAEELYGWSSVEAIGQNIVKLTPAQTTAEQATEIMKELSGGNTWSGEFLAKRKDGSAFPALVTDAPFFNSKGKFAGIIGISSDITERKRAENEIVMLGHSLKSINECISITDLDDNILFVNESFLNTYGYETGELNGKHISIVRSPTNDKSKVDEILPATIQGEWKGELFQKRKDGSEFPVSLSTTTVKDKEDKIIALIGVATDITEHKREENELIEAKEKAEESDRLKSAFLANMSHEVRTPLNSIIGFSELLGDANFPEDQKKEFVHHIISNGNNLLNIINDIVDISKIESGEIIIRKSKIQVKKLLAEISGMHMMNVEEKNLRFTTSFAVSGAEAEISVLADKARLLQIFNNLISNALKFTSEGYIELGCRPVGDRIEFHVKDTGIGIPSDYHAKIFERFRQVEASYTRKFGGNGLGLAISKNLAELMGGEIWVESKFGEGSTFYFSLPCVR